MRFERAQHAAIGRLVLADAVVNFLGAGEQLGQAAVELVDRVRFVRAENLARAFHAVALAFPHLAVGILAAHEKRHVAARLVLGRTDDQERFRLFETGQVEEVALLAERKRHVRVAQHLLGGGEQEHGPGLSFENCVSSGFEVGWNL